MGFCYMKVIAQPLTCMPSNPKVRGWSPTRDFDLSCSQRLGAGLLLGGGIEK